MTLHALICTPGVFRGGVAGSGPTRWEYHDAIRTERHTTTPAEDPGGYGVTDLVSGQARSRPRR